MGNGSGSALKATRLEEFEDVFGDSPDPFGVAEWDLVWRWKEHHLGIRQDGRLVAYAGLIVLPVSVGGDRTDVVGLGGVGVVPDQRGKGLARAVVEGAVEYARGLGPERAMLFCRPDVAPLYAGFGWREVRDDVEVEQPDGPRTMPLRTMWLPLADGARWPEGPVRLHSRPM